jgi:hypothetical protein
MIYSIVACAVIGTECAQNTTPMLLFKDRCLVTAGCCDSTILALSEYATISLIRSRSLNSISFPNQYSQIIRKFDAIQSVLLTGSSNKSYASNSCAKYQEFQSHWCTQLIWHSVVCKLAGNGVTTRTDCRQWANRVAANCLSSKNNCSTEHCCNGAVHCTFSKYVLFDYSCYSLASVFTDCKYICIVAKLINTKLTREWSDPTCRNLPWFFFHCKSTHNKTHSQNFSC